MSAVSVIMINKNRYAALHYSLDAVKNQLNYGDEFIVLDDSSEDGSYEYLMGRNIDFTALLQMNSNGNRSLVRNTGVKHSRNDILIFMDSEIIIGPYHLDQIRKHHKKENVVGVNGMVYAIDYDEMQMEYLLERKVDDWIEEVTGDFSNLKNYMAFVDKRLRGEGRSHDENWVDFYSSFASVDRKVFEKVAGFDESFCSWGGEDIELAYRLKEYGELVIDKEIYSIHYPHEKNVTKNGESTINNYYHILKKHPEFQVELLACYGGLPWKELTDELHQSFQKIISVREEKQEAVLEAEKIRINLPDKENPKGSVDYNLNGKMQSYRLLGLALPFSNLAFQTLYFSEYYTGLDFRTLSLLLQEALRLSKKVLLPKRGYQLLQESHQKPSMPQFGLCSGCYAMILNIGAYDFISHDREYFEVRWKKGALIS